MTEQTPAPDPQSETPVPRSDWRDLHLWQIQPVRDVLLVLAVLAVLKLGQMISIVTVPVLLALLLAYLVEPVIARVMTSMKWSRSLSVGATLGVVVVLVVLPLVAGLGYGVAQSVGLAQRVVGDVENVTVSLRAAETEEQREIQREELRAESGDAWLWIRDKIEEGRQEDSELGQAFEAGAQWVQSNAERIAEAFAGAGLDAVSSILGFAGTLFGLGFTAFITAFFFYFIATGWVQVKHFLAELVPEGQTETAADLAMKFDKAISGFIRGRLVIALIQSVVFSLAYFAIGVPAAFILGPAVALLSIVPYLALIGLPISITLIALEGHTGIRGEWYWIVGGPVLAYFLGQALDDYVWTPVIQGKEMGMSTPLILFATLAGGALFGVFGLLIAIPIAACLKILIEEHFWPRFRAWAEGRAADFLPVSRE